MLKVKVERLPLTKVMLSVRNINQESTLTSLGLHIMSLSS